MKNSRLSYIVFGIALIVGFIVYSLFAAGVLAVTATLPIFITIAAIATVFVAVLLGTRTKSQDSFCNCGLLALLGGLGTILLSVILALVAVPSGTIFFIAVAVLLFLFVLLIGGIACYLYNANSCGYNCGCSCRCQNQD